MVRTTKPASSVATIASIPVENVVVEKPLKKASAPKKEKKSIETTPVVETSAVAQSSEIVAAEPTDAVAEVPAIAKIALFSTKLQQQIVSLSALKTEFKVLEKAITRELKAAQKSSSRKGKRSGNRQPSGFVKPTKISDELAAFLGKPSGTEMARTSVSKEINQYIRTNSLQDKTNGRKINPDAKLNKLLKLQPTDELTYFNLQRYMKGHFTKSAPAVASV
jgi:chromatin remodeling complex protein RSC6